MRKISVIIPLYNKEISCSAAIESVLSQTYPHFELIIINDGSTDDSVHIIKKVIEEDARARLVNQANQGVSAARNNGVLEANYEYLAFLDADDLWHPYYLEVMVSALNQFPNEQWFGMSFKRFSGEVIIPPLNESPEFTKLDFLLGSFHSSTRKPSAVSLVYSDSFIITRTLFEQAGGYAVGMRYSEDVFFYYKVSKYSPIIWSPAELTYYRSDAENKEVAREIAKPLPEFMYTILSSPRKNQTEFDFIVYQVTNWIHSTIEKGTFHKELKALPLCYTLLSLRSKYFRFMLLVRYLPVSIFYYISPLLARRYLSLTSRASLKRLKGYLGI